MKINKVYARIAVNYFIKIFILHNVNTIFSRGQVINDRSISIKLLYIILFTTKC